MTRRMRLLAALPAILVFAAVSAADAQIGTAFTYQGSLEDGGAPATGSFDMQFSLWDMDSGGAQQGATIEYDVSGAGTVAVSGGLFDVSLDFGPGVFDGDPRWLEIRVRDEDPADTAPYTTLTPRVALLPVPYAVRAQEAFVAEGVTADSITSAALAPGSVTTEKIADGTITSADLAAGLRNTLDAQDGDPAGAVFVDDEGRTGIGTISPAAALHVAGPKAGKDVIFQTGGFDYADDSKFMDISGDIAWVSSSSGGALPGAVTAYDISDSENVTMRGSFPMHGLGIAIEGNTVFFVSSSNLVALDGSDPDNPALIASAPITGPGTAYDLKVSGGIACITRLSPGGLTTMDVSNPAAMTVLDTEPASNLQPRRLEVANGIAYLGHTLGGGLEVFDVSNPAGIVKRSSYLPVGHGFGAMHVVGNTLYGFKSGDVLQILDVSNPDSLVLLGSHPVPASAITSTGIHADGDYAYISSFDGFSVFEVSDPANIIARGDIALPPSAPLGQDVFLGEGIAFLNRFDELYVMEFTGGTVARVDGDVLIRGAGGSARLTLEADENDSGEANHPTILLTQDGGATSARIGYFGLSDDFQINATSVAGADIVLMPDANVGIGTATPENRLHVDGGSDASLGGGGYVQINEAAGPNLLLDDNEIMARNAGLGANLFVNHEGGNIVLAGAGNGNVGIGTSSPTLPLHVVGNAGKTSGGNTWTVISDERAKENIRPIENALDTLGRLQPVWFEYREDYMRKAGFNEQRGHYGYTAQQFSTVFPEDVNFNQGLGYLQMNAEAVQPHLVAAIKEIKAQKDAEISSLRAEKDEEIAALKARLARIEALLPVPE